MIKTIYWAVLLTKSSKNLLLKQYQPSHKKIYAEHMTIIFGPDIKQEEMLIKRIGASVFLQVIGFSKDNKGEAVVVCGEDRLDNGIPHITISCAEEIKPVYSNSLLKNGWINIEPFTIHGHISRYTKEGWKTS